MSQAKPHLQELLTAHQPQEALDLDEAVQSTLFRGAPQRLVARLPRRLAYLIAAHYGLADCPPGTFSAIGRGLGVTRQGTQQLHTEALLCMGHPTRSLQLRRLLDRNSVADYQAYLARSRRWLRTRRKAR